jgi:hypothetical protein
MCTMGEGGSCVLDRVVAAEAAEVSVDAIGEELQELFRHRHQIDAAIQRRLQRFDKAQGYSADGALSAKAWLRWKCRLSGGEASERVQAARMLPGLELVSSALAEGEISFQHASLMAARAERLGEKFAGPAEEILVTAARELDPGRLRVAVMHLRHCVEPDGVLAEADQAHQRRFLHLSQTFGGMFVFSGQFGADDGATLQTALDALMPAPGADDERTASQRRADALVEMATRQLDGGGLPSVGGQKPHLLVTVEMATLLKQPGARAAELEWAQPIPAETARRIACDCTLTPVVGGEVHGSRKVIPGWKRRALVARDKGCRFEGCEMPAAWTDAHHIQHWIEGGSDEL